MAAKKTTKTTKNTKSELKQTNKDRQAGSTPKKEMGRPKIWETPDDLYRAWTAYKEKQRAGEVFERYTKDGTPYSVTIPMPITIEGFCSSNGMVKQTFYNYKTYSKEYMDCLTRIDAEHEEYINSMVAANQFNAQWYNLYAKNKFNYSDKRTEESSVKADVNMNITSEDKNLLDKAAKLFEGDSDDN